MLRKPFVKNCCKPKPLKGQHAAAAKSLQLCPTLCDPMECSPSGSFLQGILQARTLECVAGDLPHPGIEHLSPAAPVLPADSLLLSHQGNVCVCWVIRGAQTKAKLVFQKFKLFFSSSCARASQVVLVYGTAKRQTWLKQLSMNTYANTWKRKGRWKIF